MPYIPEEDREALTMVTAEIRDLHWTPGRAAYLIALVAQELYSDMVRMSKGESFPASDVNVPAVGGYAALALVDGVLGTAQMEFRDRVVRPYEKKKRKENGGIYDV